MIMQRERMPYTGAYETVTSTTSSMYDPYVNFMEYISYWLQISEFLS